MNDMDFVIENGVLIKYIGSGGDVVIPDTVTEIGEKAFEKCFRVTSVLIPQSVVKIGVGAFLFCYDLKTITLSEKLDTIAEDTFWGCSSLTDIMLPRGLTAIGDNAFLGCEALQTITIPDGVMVLGENIFEYCKENLVVHYGGKRYKKLPKVIRDHAMLLWLKGDVCFSAAQTDYIKKELFRIRKNVSVLLKWGGNDSDSLKKCDANQDFGVLVKFPGNTVLDWDSGEMMTRLLSCGVWTSEELQECVDRMNDGRHPQIMAVLLEYKNRTFPNFPDVFVIEDDEQFDPYSEKNVKKNWTYVMDKKAGGYKITGYIGTDISPVLPERIGDIPVVATSANAFRGCAFVEIQLPDTLTSLGNLTFANCGVLEKIVLPDRLDVLPSLFMGCTNLKHVVLPKNLRYIGNATFSSCYGGGCSGYRYRAGNEKLETITICEENPNFLTKQGVLIDKEKGQILHFPAAKTEFDIPEEVTVIGTGVFAFSEIQRISIHKSVTSIGKGAFCGCEALKEIYIPEGKMKSLSDEAFLKCTNLTDIYLSLNIKKISPSAFRECPNLTIHAPVGSYAETYAKENGINFSVI